MMKLPPYKTFPTVLGQRIILREIGPSDLPYLVEISYYDAVKATDTAEAEVMQQKISNDYKLGNSIHWGIVDQETEQIVGTCGFYRGFGKEGEGELGCVLLSAFRGRGLMTDALQTAVDFGFQEMELKRIWASTAPDNYSGKKLLERLSFTSTATDSNQEQEYELLKSPHKPG